MRRTIPRKKGEDRASLNMLIPVSMDEKLREYAAETGDTLTDVVLRGIELATSGAMPATENAITFTANEKERAALKQLADGLHIGDVDLTARIVSLRLASLDIEDVREMLFGDAKRALKEKIEAKAVARKKPVGDGNGIRKVA